VIIMFLTCLMFGNNSSKPKWWRGELFILNHHVWRHIMAIWQYQDSSGSKCGIMFGRKQEERFSHMNWHLFDMCWSRLYRVLASCFVNTRPWAKMYAPLHLNKCCDASNVTVHIFGQDLVLTIDNARVLCKV